MLTNEKADQIRKGTTALYQAARDAARAVNLIYIVHEFFQAHELYSRYPTMTVDAEGRRVVQGPEGPLYEDGAPYTGEAGALQVVTDPEAVVPFAEQGLRVADYVEMGDFVATLTYRLFGNAHPDDAALTAFGRAPLGQEEMRRLRQKYSL